MVDRGVRNGADARRKEGAVPPAADCQECRPGDCLHHGPGRTLRQHGQLYRHVREAFPPGTYGLPQLALRLLGDFLRDFRLDPPRHVGMYREPTSVHGLQRNSTARRGVEGEGKQGFAGSVQAHADDDPRLRNLRRRPRWFRTALPSDEHDRPFRPAHDVQTDVSECIAFQRRESP